MIKEKLFPELRFLTAIGSYHIGFKCYKLQKLTEPPRAETHMTVKDYQVVLLKV